MGLAREFARRFAGFLNHRVEVGQVCFGRGVAVEEGSVRVGVQWVVVSGL